VQGYEQDELVRMSHYYKENQGYQRYLICHVLQPKSVSKIHYIT